MIDKIYNTAQAGKVLGLSKATLETMRSRGAGPDYLKLGGIKYLKSDLEKFIASRKVTLKGGKL